MKKPKDKDWPSLDYADLPSLISLGLEPDVARRLLDASGLTGNNGRKVVEVDRIDDVAWMLGL
jgi:hypothetical protein